MPEGREANGNGQLLPAALLQFDQRQIRLRLDPALQPVRMGSQTGTPVTANLFGQALPGPAMLIPKAFHAFATHLEAPAHFAGAFATFPGRNDSLSQILA